MNTRKIAWNLYQYTAIDNYTRYRVFQIYKKRTAGNTFDFLDRVVERCHFRYSASRSTAAWNFLRKGFSGGLWSTV